MKQAFFWCYPWDMEDEGVAAALGRMAGDVGVNAVSVVAAHHGIREIRPRAVSGPRVIQLDAAAHFQPDGKRYAKNGIRPIAASWMKSRNPLDKIAGEAEKQGLALRVSVSGCRGGAMVSKYPMASCVNVFGAQSCAWMCPSNPDVRRYVADLVEDLTVNYPVDTLELTYADFGDGRDLWRHLGSGVRPGEVERMLWSWCFCSSCRQRAMDADVDVEAVVASVTDHLDRMLRLEPATHDSFEFMLANDAHLAAYHKARVGAVTSLARMVRSQTKTRLILDLPSPRVASGAYIAELKEHCDGFLLPLPPAEAPSLHSSFEAQVREAGGAERVDVSEYCCPPRVKDGPSLVAKVHRAIETGHPAVGFFNYGLAPEPCLGWVRQAIRYARRDRGFTSIPSCY